jgi:hypothetical protein
VQGENIFFLPPKIQIRMKNRLLKGSCKRLFILLITFTCFTKTFSQGLIFGNEKIRVEAGLNFGPSFFLGDLGGNVGKGTRFIKDLNIELTKLMKGAYITVYPNRWLGVRLNANYTYLEGTDNIIDTKGVDELWRKQRNLDFKTDVWELQLGAEVFPLMIFSREDYEPRLRPYGFIGGGIFHFNPKGSLTDANGNKTWYALHPLRTEGQGMAEYPAKKEYKLTQFNIPLGAGIKYFLSDRVNVSTELLYRKTFTDYIDDVSTSYIDPNNFSKYLNSTDAAIAAKVSDKVIGIVTPGITRYAPGTQRGNANNLDAYFSFVLKFGVRLGPIYESAFARNAARQTRCPSVF